MFKQKRLTVLSMAVLLALLFAAVLPLAVFADDGVPPVDVPAVEEVVPPVDVPVVEEVIPPAEEIFSAVEELVPAVDEIVPVVEESMTVPEIMDALPEGTDLVVVDSSGDALPLASQEAADTLDSASADPFFWDGAQYVGFTAIGGTCATQVTGACTQTATPLQAAITAFGATPTATGSIYVAAGTYTINVMIDGNLGNNLANLTGLIGAGSGTTTLNGYVAVQNMNMGTNVFTFQGFTLLNGSFTAQNNTNTLNITDIVQVGNLATYGFTIYKHTGNVTLTNVDASGNYNGAYIASVTGNVTVTTNGGTSAFNNNGYGLLVDRVTGGIITINDVTMKDNLNSGFYNAGSNDSAVTLNCVTFSGNGTNIGSSGSANNTNTQTSTGCGGGGTGGGSAYVPFPVIPGSVTLVQASSDCDGKGCKGSKPNDLLVIDSIVAETTPAALGQLPGALPDGKTFAAGVSVTLMQGGVEVKSAPGGVKVFMNIPAGAKAPFTVLMWNGTAWVEVPSSVVGEQVVFTVTGPGMYALVTQ